MKRTPLASGTDLVRDEPIHVFADGPRDPAWNMAVDDALLDLRQAGAITGTWVRLFGWAPAAVSIGRLQVPEAELDLAALRAAAVPVVRRSTGGKAVYHVNELTYSLIGGVPDPTWGVNLHETYRRVTELLVLALARLGIATTFAPRRTGGAGSTQSLAAACFAVAYGHELVHAGRKICGSAQRRLTGAFLQHGSLLLGPEQAGLARFLRVDGDREALARRLAADTIDVSTAAGCEITAGEVVAGVRAVLRERFGERVVEPPELPALVTAEALRRRPLVLLNLDAEPEAPGPRAPAAGAGRAGRAGREPIP
jgi:lipoate-protein ligase A